MSAIYLKIKLKSLAAEARIIHAQERKTGGAFNALRESLHLHRVRDVRGEARATHLAYGYLRGRQWAQIENNTTTEPDWKKVTAMVRKYGPVEPFDETKFAEWCKAGKIAHEDRKAA